MHCDISSPSLRIIYHAASKCVVIVQCARFPADFPVRHSRYDVGTSFECLRVAVVAPLLRRWSMGRGREAVGPEREAAAPPGCSRDFAGDPVLGQRGGWSARETGARAAAGVATTAAGGPLARGALGRCAPLRAEG
jgi:hypothetical protein